MDASIQTLPVVGERAAVVLNGQVTLTVALAGHTNVG